MNLLSQMKLSWRLAVLVGISVLSLVVVATTGAWGLRESTQASAVLVKQHLPSVSALSDLRAAVGNLRRFEKDMFLHTGNPDSIENYHKRWEKTAKQAHELIARLADLLEADQKSVLDAARKGLQGYERGLTQVAEKLLRGEYADPIVANKAMEPLKADVRALDEQLDKLDANVEQSAQAKGSALQRLESRQFLLQGVALGLTTLLLAIAAWGIVRSIVGPLGKASESLGRLADGDLSQAIDSRGRDELAQMMMSMARTQAALREVVGNIQANAQSVATASSEIAQGNADLSSRTERQAASLQQTAASMEELTSTVRQGAESARRANDLALAASHTAARGGEVVTRVVQTMSDIQAASRQIADITGVIDGIAFQTNILALNAAVEAARAGEQGRGFAVVASEVRLLAQRSAEAAKQIKSLIAASVERVESGHDLVQDAGRTMSDVVEQVRQVTTLMSGVTTAAEEQQRGIDQVGQAVTELDQATQQNAALVEQSAAATESLRVQADRLSEAVSVFRLAAQRA